MASSTQQVQEKEKAAVDEVLKEAKSYLLTNNNIDQTTTMAVGTIKGSHNQQMRYYKSKNWTGNFMARIPELINGGDRTVIMHKGSKGAVIYGLQSDAPRPLGWLLAWSKPGSLNQPNWGGTLEKNMKKDWNDIEQKLDTSGDYCHHSDQESGVVVTAGIQDDSLNVAHVGSMISYSEGMLGLREVY